MSEPKQPILLRAMSPLEGATFTEVYKSLPEDFEFKASGPNGSGLYYSGPLPRNEAMHECLLHLARGCLK